jgi:hypothetical protein
MIEDGKYKGMICVKNVDIFVENQRTFTMPSGEKKTINFTPEWCQEAIRNAKFKYVTNGFLAPSHVGHNGKDGEEREAAGLFLPTRLEQVNYQGNPKILVFADLVMPPDIWEEAKNLKLPYRSVEIEDPKVPAFSSLAFLKSRPPFMETSPLVPYMAFSKNGHVLCYSASFGGQGSGRPLGGGKKAITGAVKDIRKISGPGLKKAPTNTILSTLERGDMKESKTGGSGHIQRTLDKRQRGLERELSRRGVQLSADYGGPGSGPQKGHRDTLNRTKGENLDGSIIDKVARTIQDPVGLAKKIGNPFTLPGRLGAHLIDRSSSLIHDNDSEWENEMERRGAFNANGKAKFGIKDKLEEGAYKVNIAATDAANALKNKLKGASAGTKADASFLAQKMAKNWGSVKQKLLSHPKYRELLGWLKEDIDAGSGPRGGWTNAENMGGYLIKIINQIPQDELFKLQDFLFSKDVKMSKKYASVDEEGEKEEKDINYTKPMDPTTRGKVTKAKLDKIESQIPELEKLIERYKSEQTDRSFPADLPAAKKRLSRRVERAAELTERLKELRRYVRTLKGQVRGSVGFSEEEELLEEEEVSANFDESDDIENKIQALEEEAKSEFSAEDEMEMEEEEEENPIEFDGDSPSLSDAGKQSIVEVLTAEGFSIDQANEMVAKLLEGIGFSAEDDESQEAEPEVELFQRPRKNIFNFQKGGDVNSGNKALRLEIQKLTQQQREANKKMRALELKEEVSMALQYAKTLSDGYNFSALISAEVPTRYKKEGKAGVKRLVEGWKNAVALTPPADLDSAHFTSESQSSEQDKLDFVAKYPQFSSEIETFAMDWKRAKKELPNYQYTMKEHIDINLYPLVRG